MIIPMLNTNLEKLKTRILVQGKVVDNVDPLKKSRVRVSIPNITDKLSKDILPWYSVVQGNTNSHTTIPPVNTRVVVYYVDIYNALVLGSIVSTAPN